MREGVSITAGTTGPQNLPGACPGPLSSKAPLGLVGRAPLLLASPHPPSVFPNPRRGVWVWGPLPSCNFSQHTASSSFMGSGARCGVHVRRLDALFDWESVSWHLPRYHPPPSTHTHTPCWGCSTRPRCSQPRCCLF